MTLPIAPLAILVFEPYLSLFSIATAAGAVAGTAYGVVLGRFKIAAWIQAALFLPALGAAFLLATAAQSLAGLVWPRLGGGPSWGALGQSSVGFVFGWGLWAMVGTYLRIFERSGRRLAWGLLGLRLAGILLLVVMLANPVWKHVDVDPGHVVVVLDDSRSMSLPHPDGGTRYDRAKAAVDKLRHALESNPNGPRVAVDLYDVNGDRLDGGAPTAATVDRTDLMHALDQAILKARGSHFVVGVVLVSDGMDTTGRKDFQSWGGESVPFYGLGFPDTANGDLDLAVAATDAPRNALVRNELPVRVTVGKKGAAAVDAVVSLKRGATELVAEKVHFDAGDHQQIVALNYTPDQTGEFVFTASVTAEATEPYLGNNALSFPMRIDADPIRVLYVEGLLRYESRYLQERLRDDPDVTLFPSVRTSSPESGAVRTEFLTDERLKQADVVILGDLILSDRKGQGPTPDLSPAEQQRLKQWLDEKNHSLLVLGGYKSFGPDGFRDTPLADDLPVVFAAGTDSQSEEPVHLRLTDRGQGHPIFTLSGDRQKDAETWAGMPALPGMCLVQRVKPAAEELAVNPAVTVDGKPAVVAAAQTAPGGGRVLVLTIDSTWQWSRLARLLGQTDAPYNRLWSQTVRWLAGRDHDSRPLLTVSTDRAYYELGGRVNIRLARQSRPDLDVSQASPSLEITGPDGKLLPPNQTPAPTAGPSQPDRFSAQYTPVASGRYQVNAVLTAEGKPLTNQLTDFYVQGPDLELADTRTSIGTLRALAKGRSDTVFTMDQAEELAKRITRQDRMGPEHRDPYWNSPLLFLAFLGCVSAEWFLRRWNQMV